MHVGFFESERAIDPERSASRGKNSKTRSTVQVSPRTGFVRRTTVRFSRVVKDPNTRRPCGTIAMPAREIRWLGLRVMSTPSYVIDPLSTDGGRRPQIVRTSVVLPMPLRPSRATLCPSAIAKSTPFSTRAVE
jgi:hypothetical protein